MPAPRRTSAAIAAAAVALAVLNGCSTSDQPPSPSNSAASRIPTGLAPLPDDQKDRVFASILAERDITLSAPGAVGSQVCGGFDRATPAPTVVADTQTSTQTSPDQAGYIIGAAVATYCPQHLTDLKNSIG